jgi:hypothetical protein
MNIQPDDVQASMARFLDPAFERSHDSTADEYIQRCRDDLAQLWTNGSLYAITEVRKIHSGLALHIVAMAGEFDQKLVDEMEEWGRSVGCKSSYFSGRKGWARKMPDYEQITVTLQKEL